MTAKPTEEGWFWEWRTFDDLPDVVVERVRAYPLRHGAGGATEDLYFVSAHTEQNVKLRWDGAALKLKPLLARVDGGFELYEETARLVFEMPVPGDAVAKAASLLGVEVDVGASAGRDAILAAFAKHEPAIRRVRVRKRRIQYAVDGGWVELADLEFPAATVRSLGVQSARLAETRRIRELLDPDRALTATSYVEACRRWGAAPSDG